MKKTLSIIAFLFLAIHAFCFDFNKDNFSVELDIETALFVYKDKIYILDGDGKLWSSARPKKIVNEFFANLSINKNQTLKTNMMKISEDDDINSSEFNVNENINKDEKNNDKEEQKEEKENDIANDFEIIEFKKTENYDMWIEKNLLNMFIEEENSEKNSLIYKTKGIIAINTSTSRKKTCLFSY